MIIKKIEYSTNFIKDLKKLPRDLIDIAIKKEKIFKENPLHPSLRLHELRGDFKGIWSISVNTNYRIIFERQTNGDILFISIGNHNIYRHL